MTLTRWAACSAPITLALVLSACGSSGALDGAALNAPTPVGEARACAPEGSPVTLGQFEDAAPLAVAGTPLLRDHPEHRFTVAEGCGVQAVQAVLEWDLLVEDLDLEIYGPDGTLLGNGAEFNAVSGEAREVVALGRLSPGEYRARVVSFAAAEAPYVLTIAGLSLGGDAAAPAPEEGPNTDATPPPDEAKAGVIVAVLDSAINPYHSFFRQGGALYGDSEPDAITLDVLRRLGVPERNWINLTVTGDMAADLEADRAFWDGVERGELYWFRGTNIVAVSFAGENVPRLRPDTSKSPHGIGTSAAVLKANPEAVILFVEQGTNIGNDPSHEFAFGHPAVDILSTSYGVSIPQTGFPLPETRPFLATYKAAVTLGKLHFSSGGNGPGLTPLRAGAGPWWSIGVSGNEEESTEGRSVLSGNFPDFISDFTQPLPYCHTGQDCFSNVGGTSFSTPRAAGVTSRVLLEARRALGHTEGIVFIDNAPFVAVGAERMLNSWVLRRAMEQAAWIPSLTDYDPTAAPTGSLQVASLPFNPVAPWLQTGWGDLTALPEKSVVDAALSHLGLGAAPRTKTTGFCEFMTENMLARLAYWDELAPLLPGGLSSSPNPERENGGNPLIWCPSSNPLHPACNDPGGC